MASKHKSLVRKLIGSSINAKGIIEQSLVEDVLRGLKESKPAQHLEILKEYELEIRKALRQQLVEVELGCLPTDNLADKLKSKIAVLTSQSLDLRVSQNEALIAGYRIRLVDDVFEASIQSRRSKLSQSLTS